MQLVIDTANTSLTVRNKCFFIQNKSIKRQISPKRITSIAITTNCTLNTAVIKLAANNQVPILFFNNFGTIQARLWSPYFINIAELRKKQLIFSESKYATEWIINILKRKTDRQIENLKYLSAKYPKNRHKTTKIIEEILKIRESVNSISNELINNVRQELMGYEGSISRYYFKAINIFMPKSFNFESRTRRPAKDYFNAALNYLYGMTYSVVESGVFAKGLDPFIGIMHTDNYARPTLVYDLIEPIRPVMDKILFDIILNQELTPDCFVVKSQGFWLNKKGKRIIIPAFNEFLYKRIKVNNKIRRLKDHIYSESNDLGNYIDKIINLV